MRAVIFLTIMLSCSAYSWECPETGNSTKIEDHWNAASIVFWGKVIEGKYEDRRNIYIKVNVFDYFKGVGSQTYDFQTSHDELFHGLEVGSNYVFYLNNNKRLDFCGVHVALPYHRNSIKSVLDFYAGDLEQIPLPIKYALSKAGRLP
jgi:hypothetical protein